MDAKEIRRQSAAAERMAAGMSGFDRQAWQAIAEQWIILARLRDGLKPPERPPPAKTG